MALLVLRWAARSEKASAAEIDLWKIRLESRADRFLNTERWALDKGEEATL